MKKGIMLIVSCLNLLQASAVKEITPPQDAPQGNVVWDNSLCLPDAGGKPHPGVAGAFSGFAGDCLVVAGGANFPDAVPWRGGHKTWHNAVYFINPSLPGAQWTLSPQTLPAPLAYGCSIQLAEGILCIGGCDASQCYREVFLIRLTDGEIRIDTDWPALPVPLANATASMAGRKIYVAGGQTGMKAEEATANFFVLDLDNRARGWQQLPAWPGEPRGYAVSAAQSNGRDVCFYLFSGRDYRPGGYMKVLTDGYVFNPRLQTWEKLKAAFPVMAGNALATGADRILLLGGVPRLIPGGDDHPGFDNTVRLFHTVSQRVVEQEAAPYPLAVTTNVARKNDVFYITSGEIKPGIRTPHLLKGEIIGGVKRPRRDNPKE